MRSKKTFFPSLFLERHSAKSHFTEWRSTTILHLVSFSCCLNETDSDKNVSELMHKFFAPRYFCDKPLDFEFD